VTSQPDAFCRKSIQIGRWDFLLTETADFAPTKIISQNEYDIRTLRRIVSGNAVSSSQNSAKCKC
jgi:hypothetical protein